VLQAVIDIPMSRRQLLQAAEWVVDYRPVTDLKKIEVTGHSILRGLTFIEWVMTIDSRSRSRDVAAASLMHFIIEAEGIARRGESDEFALLFAEVFPYGRPHEPEAVLLPDQLQLLGIGGTDEQSDNAWAQLLSRHYNPAARRPGEVKFKRETIS
jgi:hypothetical protein